MGVASVRNHRSEGDGMMQMVIAPRTSVMPDNAAPDWQFSECPGYM